MTSSTEWQDRELLELASTDDGAAIRLAIKYGISIQFSQGMYSVGRPAFDICCQFGPDQAADIRQAIVRAAAASVQRNE